VAVPNVFTAPIAVLLLLSQVLAGAKRPVIVVGSSLLQREDGPAVMAAVASISQNALSSGGVDEGWKVLNVLHRSLSF